MTANQETLNAILQDWSLWPILKKFNPTDCEFTLLEQGLTNKNWLVTLPNLQGLNSHESSKALNHPKQFVIRINAENAKSLHIDHKSEYEIVQAVSALEICPEILYKDPDFRYWVRPYICGETLAEQLPSTPHIENDLVHVAQVFKSVHQVPTQAHWPSINTLERTEYFWRQILPNPAFYTDQILKFKEQLDIALKATNPDLALCHMDPNIHNWIKDDHNQLSLIDWEYAGLGNPIWDLAVFSDSAQLNKTQEQQLLEYYGKYSSFELEHAKLQMEYLSILWFAVQEHTHSNTFLCELKNLALRAQTNSLNVSPMDNIIS